MTTEMEADIARWARAKREREEKQAAAGKAVGTFAEVRAQLAAAFEQLPEKVVLPYELTPEGERLAKFKALLSDSPEFLAKIDRTKLPNAEAFDRVAKWDGGFPGPCAIGDTDTGKTRAAWSALGRLYVKCPYMINGAEVARSFAWFPVRRLVTEIARYEEAECADAFFRMYDFQTMLFVDDVDKLNWQFDSEKTALFAFYDWIYRRHKPCITTTNKPRKWWADKMGEAFARRLFDDAHFAVQF